jgi:3-oxoacyl-(acyl-carrier-protein) synthase
MHGTGTPLGDPIEVGAAAGVLACAGSVDAVAQPLRLLASKSWTGHAEPAAGLVGLEFGGALLRTLVVPQAMHLGAVNPHVAATLGESGVGGGRCIGAGRGSAAFGAASPAAVGASSFAFQATRPRPQLFGGAPWDFWMGSARL